MDIVKTFGSKRRRHMPVPRAFFNGKDRVTFTVEDGKPFSAGDYVALHLLANEKFVLAKVRAGVKVCKIANNEKNLNVIVRGIKCEKDVFGVVVGDLIEFPPQSFEEIDE